jgi:hypothetical protein
VGGSLRVRRPRTERAHENDRLQASIHPDLESRLVFADHTAYWDNRDGFVLRVARVCAETAQSPWVGELAAETEFVDKRAAWRVGFLRIARWSTSLTWLLVGSVLWTRHQASIPVPFDLPTWSPVAPVRFTLLVASILLPMWATSKTLRLAWSWWVRAEQEAVLNQDQLAGMTDRGWGALICMAIVIWILVFTAWDLIFSDWVSLKSNLADLSTDLSTFLGALIPAFGLAVGSTWVLVWLKPPPASPGPADHA